MPTSSATPNSARGASSGGAERPRAPERLRGSRGTRSATPDDLEELPEASDDEEAVDKVNEMEMDEDDDEEEEEGEENDEEDEEGEEGEEDDDDDDEDPEPDNFDEDDEQEEEEEEAVIFKTEEAFCEATDEDKWAYVQHLRWQVRSWRMSANACGRRKKHERRQRDGPANRGGAGAALPGDEETEAQKKKREKSRRKQHEREAKFFVDELKLLDDMIPYVLNRVALAISPEHRAVMRGLGFLAQEWFLVTREAAERMQTHLFTAENTLEMRLRELISVRALRRMRRVLTTTWNPASRSYERLVLMHPPKSRGKGGGNDPSLKKGYNDALKIFKGRPVYAPSPIAEDGAVRAAAAKLLNGRKISVAIPSEDGLSGCAWDLVDVCRDLFKAVAPHLRTLRMRDQRYRIWIGFDGLTWTKRNGLVRWCVRTPDLAASKSCRLNDPQWSREGITYTGEDKNQGLIAASRIGGGETSIRARLDNGVVVTKVAVTDLPAAVQADTSEKGLAMQKILCYECEVQIDVGPEGQAQKSQVVQGGDRVAGHAAFGLDSCIERTGVCMRCLCRKPDWTNEQKCNDSVRRTAVLQCLLNHVDPRKRMKGYTDIEPLSCPCCDVPITEEFMKEEQDKFDKLNATNQKKWMREHSKRHLGGMWHEELVVFQDSKWRGSSNLHRRTNMAHNNVLATFMAVEFDAAKRLRANEAMEDAGMMTRFPTKSRKQRISKLANGDEARILHSNPALLLGSSRASTPTILCCPATTCKRSCNSWQRQPKRRASWWGRRSGACRRRGRQPRRSLQGPGGPRRRARGRSRRRRSRRRRRKGPGCR